MLIWTLPPQAQPLGQLGHAASKHQPAFQRLPQRLSQAADCVLREPEHVPRHARLLHPNWRSLDEEDRSTYARWAPRHNSLLIVTFDENAGGTVKSIPTIIVGANVRPGVYPERLDHYALLRTIEDVYELPALGRAKTASPLSKIWMRSPIPRGRR